MKNIGANMFMALVTVACASMIGGMIYHIETDKQEKFDYRAVVPAQYIRALYYDHSVDQMKNGQLFGDAEVGLTGHKDIMDGINQMALELIPDGEYLQIIRVDAVRSKRSIEGYRFVWEYRYYSYFIKD